MERTTPRERLLLAGLTVGAILFGAVSAFDYRTAQEDLYSEALADRVRAMAARSAAARASQGAPDEAALEDMRQWGLKASNVSIAQVRVEGLLVTAANRAQLVSPRITADRELEEVGPTRWIRANVETDLNWTPTFAFLDELARLDTGFRVVSFGFDVEAAPQQAQTGEFRAPRGRIRLGIAVPVEVVDEAAP